MKKIFLLCTFLLLCYWQPVQAEPTTVYHNPTYGFSVALPTSFTDLASKSEANLVAKANKNITIQILQFKPQTYSGSTFGTLKPEEIKAFMQRQGIVTSIKTPNFKFFNSDTNVTATKFPYFWMMFIAGTQAKGEVVTTTLLKNYFLNNDKLIEIDFIMSGNGGQADIDTVNHIIDSFKFD